MEESYAVPAAPETGPPERSIRPWLVARMGGGLVLRLGTLGRTKDRMNGTGNVSYGNLLIVLRKSGLVVLLGSVVFFVGDASELDMMNVVRTVFV